MTRGNDEILAAVNLNNTKIDELKAVFEPKFADIYSILEESKKAIKANTDKINKFDKLLKSRDATIKEQSLSICALEEDTKKKDVIIKKLGCSSNTLQEAYRYAINKLNYFEQRRRSYTAKFHNLSAPSTLSNLDLQRFVFDTFCTPAFELAKSDGRIKVLRKFATCIDTGHYLGQGKSFADKAKPAPAASPNDVDLDQEEPAEDSLPAGGRNLLMRFNSRNDKTVFMIYKKTVIQKYNKDNNCKIRVGEDLSAGNRSIMNLLCGDDFPEVAKNVRIRNSRVQFALEAEKKEWQTVHNVYANTLEEMVKELVDPTEKIFGEGMLFNEDCEDANTTNWKWWYDVF